MRHLFLGRLQTVYHNTMCESTSFTARSGQRHAGTACGLSPPVPAVWRPPPPQGPVLQLYLHQAARQALVALHASATPFVSHIKGKPPKTMKTHGFWGASDISVTLSYPNWWYPKELPNHAQASASHPPTPQKQDTGGSL